MFDDATDGIGSRRMREIVDGDAPASADEVELCDLIGLVRGELSADSDVDVDAQVALAFATAHRRRRGRPRLAWPPAWRAVRSGARQALRAGAAGEPADVGERERAIVEGLGELTGVLTTLAAEARRLSASGTGPTCERAAAAMAMARSLAGSLWESRAAVPPRLLDELIEVVEGEASEAVRLSAAPRRPMLGRRRRLRRMQAERRRVLAEVADCVTRRPACSPRDRTGARPPSRGRSGASR